MFNIMIRGIFTFFESTEIPTMSQLSLQGINGMPSLRMHQMRQPQSSEASDKDMSNFNMLPLTSYFHMRGEIIRSRVYMFLVLFKPSPAATIRKKQAKQLEALASPRPTILIHGKANRNIRFGLHRAGAAAVHKDFHVLKIVSPGASLELD